MKIIKAQIQHMPIVRELFREYQVWLNADCCFQGFEEELANLPGSYAEPKGVIFLAFDDDINNGINNDINNAIDYESAIGCSAIRPRSENPETESELKRLYVKQSYRGHGVGKALFKRSMLSAKELGYQAVVLETLPEKMKEAQFLYRDFGFKQIMGYGDNSDSKVTDDAIEYYRYVFKGNLSI